MAFGVLCMIAFDQLLQSGFRKSKEDVSGKMNVLLKDSSNFDILCLGSSRALAHFDTEVISKMTGLRIYNGGLNGARVTSMAILLEGYLKAHPAPRYLILHLDEFTLETDQMLELPHYLPFLPDPKLESRLAKFESEVKYLAFFPPLRITYYDDLKKWIGVKSFFGISPQFDQRNGFSNQSDSGWNGYWENAFTQKLELMRSPFDSVHIFNDGAALLDEVFELASKNNIRIMLTSSPLAGGELYSKYEAAIKIAENVASKSDAKVVFYWNHDQPLDRRIYYYDLVHMVRKGALEYSMRLSDSLMRSFETTPSFDSIK